MIKLSSIAIGNKSVEGKFFLTNQVRICLLIYIKKVKLKYLYVVGISHTLK